MTPCLTLGLTALVGPVDDYPVALRLARDAEGRDLVLTKDERRLVAAAERDASARARDREVEARTRAEERVAELEKTVKAYVREAIEIERAGLQVQFKKTEDFELPEELESKLAASARLKKAFAALTPGRQRGYIFHFSQPKQSKTRAARVQKHIPRILEGLGLDD